MARSKSRSDLISGISSLQLPKKEGGNLLYYILMALFIIALTGGIILLRGMVRLTLGILILFLIGFNLVYWSVEKTKKSNIWRREGEFDEEVNLRLRKTSDLVKRAFEGMELSQGFLEKKLRDLYLDKLMEERNLSQEEVRELLNNPEEFRRVVDDELISDFILSKKDEEQNLVEDEQSSSERLEGEDYERWISKLLKRIEEWE